MAEFDEKTKLRVVMALAQFEAPADIVRGLLAEDIEASVRQICGYDPTRSLYDAGEKWRAIFDAERARYMTEVQSVPIANQGFRLNALQKSYEKAMNGRTPNLKLANEILEQAAKEVGGALTNERTLNTKNDLSTIPPDERRAIFEDLIAGMMGQKPNAPGTETRQ